MSGEDEFRRMRRAGARALDEGKWGGLVDRALEYLDAYRHRLIATLERARQQLGERLRGAHLELVPEEPG